MAARRGVTKTFSLVVCTVNKDESRWKDVSISTEERNHNENEVRFISGNCTLKITEKGREN